MGYAIQNIPCNLGNYTQQANTHEWIMIHYTATTASAANNGSYFASNSNCGASAHFFVDGSGTIINSVPVEYVAWHAGNWNANCAGIGIEVVSAGADFTSTEIAELTWLVHSLMEQYNIPADRVIRHYDVADHFTGNTTDPHKRCPAPYVDNTKWQQLHSTITNGDDNMTPSDFWNYGLGTNATSGYNNEEAWKHLSWTHHDTAALYADLCNRDMASVQEETGEYVNSGASMAERLAYCEAYIKRILKQLDSISEKLDK